MWYSCYAGKPPSQARSRKKKEEDSHPHLGLQEWLEEEDSDPHLDLQEWLLVQWERLRPLQRCADENMFRDANNFTAPPSKRSRFDDYI